MLDDVTAATLHSALNGLSFRQRVIADNIANLQTPGYIAGSVDFETALADAVSDRGPFGASPADVTPTLSRSNLPTRLDGNNVDLDGETLSNIDTNLRYNLVLRAMDAKFGLIRDAMRGGA